ncbi:MAG: Putative predicted metal-dependent hydrolase [uncultured Sulfurovum sp.]|uniref:Predicted metal-dependent hydrolase n=1 Tax=uncultured Sulfurovum sp. TaxID=269237 RepID=A0A6S6SU38_9BACT|nr:MAG: Putative predicted metal-dependent hydrolase [uncultured Sulfurovum sp.]
MSLLPTYIHIVKPKLKHIYLSFNDEGHLVVKSPKISLARIEKLLLQKASWINASRKKLAQKKGKALTFTQDSQLYFLGESHPLELIAYDKKRTKLLFDGDTFRLYYSQYDVNVFQKHIDTFYKNEAQAYIPTIVQQWAETMQLTPSKISFRKTKRQWGSCSSKNALSFNTMTMKLPLDVIKYIIIHELAHIQHKHHQKAFWALVEQYLPTYKQCIQELKNYTT